MDLIFDPATGLGLRQARYNIYGGNKNDPNLDKYRPGAWVEAYQPGMSLHYNWGF